MLYFNLYIHLHWTTTLVKSTNMIRDYIKIDVCANWLTSGINFNKFFVVLHGEKQCKFSFVIETPYKSIIAFYCTSKFTWCFHSTNIRHFLCNKIQIINVYRECSGPFFIKRSKMLHKDIL